MSAVDPAHRRAILLGLGASALSACVTRPAARVDTPVSIAAPRPRFARAALAPLDMRPERITRITVCTRPFRHAGPRIEVETIGDKRIVHNYGHGGSGWSLSWGSSSLAAALALDGGATDFAVIGCGALGLTTATLLQRTGAKVVIYAAERAAETRSARASGVWTPDSRIADADRVDATFPALWERMARLSWARHQTYVGLPGEPVAFLDRYTLADARRGGGGPRPAPNPAAPKPIRFAAYGHLINDIVPHSHDLAAGEHPFPVASARVGPAMQFNIADLSHRLTTDFLLEGGRIETRLFHTPNELTALSQPVIVNCTGYGARALFNDLTVTPVRGQMAWLPPQPEVRYGLYHNGVSIISRPDGVGVQALRGGDMRGYDDATEKPDRSEAEQAVAVIAALYAKAEALT